MNIFNKTTFCHSVIFLTVLSCFIFANPKIKEKKVIATDSCPTNSTDIFKNQNNKAVSYIVTTQILHKINDNIFGTFMERPSWYGETGIEAAVIPGTHKLQPKVIEMLQEMKIPVIRFPSGTDIDYTDWADMIDNVPWRTNSTGVFLPRPVTIGHKGGSVSNYFGYDEFFKLCEKLGSEAILPVNFRSSIINSNSLSNSALHAASLVAYCNASVGAALPSGMRNWPAVRASNGFVKPFGCKYFQIGNETWFFDDSLSAKKYAQYVKVYVDKMKEVDPTIKIIVDANSASHVTELKKVLGTNIDYLVQHDYVPWGINDHNLEKNGEPWTVDQVTDEEAWYGWVGVPNSFNSAGESIIEGMAIEQGRSQGYKVAITEWNLNGWWKGTNTPVDSFCARGLGAVSYLHAFMRAGNVVEIACQCMTIGKKWPINSIRVSQTQDFEPYFLPTGQIILMYSKYHGNNFLAIKGKNVQTYKQPFKMNWLSPSDKVAMIDALVTENSSNIFFHVINRHYSKNIPVSIDVSAFKGVSKKGIHRKLQCIVSDNTRWNGSPIGYFTNSKFNFNGKKVNLILPKQSVSIIQFDK